MEERLKGEQSKWSKWERKNMSMKENKEKMQEKVFNKR